MNVTFAKSLSSIGTFTLRRTLTPSTFTPVKRTISSFTPIVYNTLTRKANTCVTVAAQYQPQQQRQQQQQLVLSPRFYTSSNAPATLDPSSVVDMKYVDDLVRDADDDYILIDVRNPDEVSKGFIPTAVNIPLPEVESALKLDESSFFKKYGVEKPMDGHREPVFYCLAGVRSEKATLIAQSLGLKSAKSYKGSWSEWSKYH